MSVNKNTDNIFFIVLGNKKGRRLSDSLVLIQGTAKHRATDKFTEKPMPIQDRELFAHLFSLLEIGGFWIREQ